MTGPELQHILGHFEDPTVAAAAPAPDAGLGSILALRTHEARLAGGWDESRQDSTEALVRGFAAKGFKIEMIGSRSAKPELNGQTTPTAPGALTRNEAAAPRVGPEGELPELAFSSVTVSPRNFLIDARLVIDAGNVLNLQTFRERDGLRLTGWSNGGLVLHSNTEKLRLPRRSPAFFCVFEVGGRFQRRAFSNLARCPHET